LATLASIGRKLAGAFAINNAIPFAGATQDRFVFEWDQRKSQYERNEAFLGGSIYDGQDEGGFREAVLDEVFQIQEPEPDSATPAIRLLPYFNPIPAVVGLYQNVLRGTFGKEIKVADTVDDEPTNPALLQTGRKNPIRQIWQRSNLDTNKAAIIELAANLGCVGLRILASNDGTERKVAIQFDHPGRILDHSTNSEGHVTEIELLYTVIAGELGAKRRDVRVHEVFSKTRIFQEVDGTTTVDIPNELGVCPYVILRHGGVQKEYGRWAYKGAEKLIHIVNWLISNFGDSIYEHIWPTWFASAGGKKPDIFYVGRTKVAYTQTREGTPPPSLEALVARMDFAGAVQFVQMIGKTSLIKQLPELLISEIEALSGQSGETIAKLQVPSEAAIEQAKPNYEDAFIRAVKIGLSEMVRMGMVDLGSGTGTREAADRSFRSGQEEFAFVDRPALPQTVFDKIQQQTLETAGEKAKVDLAATKAKALPVSDDEILRTAGYDDKQIAKIKAEMSQQDVLPDDTGGDTVQGGAANA
jgi:hypothetical protein